ncbi:hypothetical protein COLO4_14626 [Corchorus olitorius]|uniref:KIB1-4 beta-propeller domain-containing protein n=1 Tax=Corchorus olitorius TaxID=93759 RepID=A0A1R3JRH9_9ROSI|nr:hypothetical protein COLO4_14626 [Corchorus olitorius]
MSKINQDSAKHHGNKEEVIIKKDLWGRGLPTELLELILSKLIFVVDIQKFHCVCKTWQSITVSVSPPRQLRSPLPYADSSFPLLFQINPSSKLYRVLHPLYNYIWDMHFPPQLVGDDNNKTIYFSKYGWSLMAQDFRQPFLFNPLTQETIILPTMPFYPGYSPCMLFTCPPSQPDCLVVAIPRRNSSIYVHKLGETDWKKHDLKGKMDGRSFGPICHPILYQGLCYFLDQNRNLVEFDIQDIENTWIVHHKLIPPPHVHKVLAFRPALVEHNGQLIVVLIQYKGGRPYIFKLNLQRKRKSCERVQSLGKNALFISFSASFCQRAIASGTGNKILFHS